MNYKSTLILGQILPSLYNFVSHLFIFLISTTSFHEREVYFQLVRLL